MGEKVTHKDPILDDLVQASPNDENTKDDVYYRQLEKLKKLLGNNETSLWINYNHVGSDTVYTPLAYDKKSNRLVGYYDFLEDIRRRYGDDAVEASFAHELGHWYDLRHPEQRYPLLDSYHLDGIQRLELRADLIGACFTGKPQAFTQLYTELAKVEVIPVSAEGEALHLRMAVRMDMIGKLKPSDCPANLRSRTEIAQRQPPVEPSALPILPPTPLPPPLSKPEWQCAPPGLPGDIYEIGACTYLPNGSSASRSPER